MDHGASDGGGMYCEQQIEYEVVVACFKAHGCCWTKESVEDLRQACRQPSCENRTQALIIRSEEC